MKDKIEITHLHPSVTDGVPVILQGREVVSYAAGLKAILDLLDMTKQDYADLCGYKNEAVVTQILKPSNPQKPPAAVLNRLDKLLQEHSRKDS